MSALPDFSSRRASSRQPAASGARLTLIAGAGLLLLALALAFDASRALELARAAERDARQAAREAQERVRAARAETAAAGDAPALRARTAGAAPPPRVLAALQKLMPGAVRLEQATLAYSAQVELELRVVARSAGDYDAFIERLSEAAAFRTLSSGPENREGEVRAVIRVQYAGTAAP